MSSGESMYKLDSDGDLVKNIVISQILGPKNEKYKEPFINNNLVDNIDHERLAKNQWTGSRIGVGYCPNFYRGGDNFLEKFTQNKKIEIKLTEKAKNSLIITNNDVKKFTSSKTGGAFGEIFFLEKYELENDHLSKDNNKLLKSKIVIKKQRRQFKFGTDVESAEKCFAINELIAFQMGKSRTDFAHSDLYLNHFYCASEKDPTAFDLFIVMKKCDLVISDLIKLIHGPKCKLRSFTPTKKFPTIILKDLIHSFLNGGSVHNDLKPENQGYMLGKDSLPIAGFIDYGSQNGYGINEPKGVKISVFPGTVLYLSPNKTKLLAIDLSNITVDDDNNMPEMDELLQSTKYDTQLSLLHQMHDRQRSR